jgi:hypothetical protein
LKILFTSGSGQLVVEEILQDRTQCHFLPKPYGFQALVDAVAESVDSVSQPGAHVISL